MPHPSATTIVTPGTHVGWGKAWGLHWGGQSTAGSVVGGQVVIRHDRSTTKKKRLRQRQRM